MVGKFVVTKQVVRLLKEVRGGTERLAQGRKSDYNKFINIARK